MEESPRMRNPAYRKIEWKSLLFVLIASLLVGIWVYRPQQGNTVAVITTDGIEVRQIVLNDAQDGIFSILEETGKPVSFEVSGGKVRFVNVECPDHLCEKSGWCDSPGKRAVCMPNRTTLVCYDAQELT